MLSQSGNTDSPSCPSDAVLSAFKNGELAPALLDDMAAHLDLCVSCIERLDRLPDQPFVGIIRKGFTALNEAQGDGLRGFEELVRQREAEESAAKRDQPRQIGSYRILELIGEGATGRVYRALHVLLNKPVAVKILRLKNDGVINKERFLMEMKAFGRVESPHLAKTRHAGIQGELYYIATDLLHGVTADSFVQLPPCLSIPNACEIIRQAALGLAAIHEQHLAHGGIKPSNLVLGNDGVVKILDFGLAHWNSSHESAVTNEASADLHHLGATFYRLLAGPGEILPLGTNIPPAIVALVSQLLAEDPREQPSAATAAKVLEPFASSNDVRTLVHQRLMEKHKQEADSGVQGAVFADGRMVRYLKRRSVPLLAGLGVLVLILGGAVVYRNLVERSDQPPSGAVSPLPEMATTSAPIVTFEPAASNPGDAKQATLRGSVRPSTDPSFTEPPLP